jgi:hypothetical protein
MKKFAIEIKWALISILLFLAWMTLEKEMGYHDINIKWQPVFNLLYIFPMFIVYLLALLEKKNKYYHNQMNWKQGMIAAVVISFIFVFFSPITQFIIHEIISPNFLKNSIDFTVSQKKLTLTEAKEYTTLTSSIWKNISDGLSFGVVIGAIVAYLIQSKPIESTK